MLGRISDLELVARIVVEGLVSGLHRSPFHGYSAEFSQYRHYRPGDDLKYVDWKLVARTDRVYTKQFRETTNLRGDAGRGHQRLDGVPRRADREIPVRRRRGGGARAPDLESGRRGRPDDGQDVPPAESRAPASSSSARVA